MRRAAHALEQAAKVPLFGCKDCGDCSLPEIAYVCPESQCAKNQRNGPCGGTRDGLCEVYDTECIWSEAYERLKAYGEEESMLDGPVVVKDNALAGTSAWANTFLGRDHQARDDRVGSRSRDAAQRHRSTSARPARLEEEVVDMSIGASRRSCRRVGSAVEMARELADRAVRLPGRPGRVLELAGRAGGVARDVRALRPVAPHDGPPDRGPGRDRAPLRRRRQHVRELRGRTRRSSSSPATTTAT